MSKDTNTNLYDIDLSKPRWSQDNYFGRARYFFTTVNPLNTLLSSQELDEAKDIVTKQRNKEPLPPGLTVDQLWAAKHKYDSAFHPETGEKMFVLGRMSAQVPANMFITGCMMTFYQSTRAVLFWQWVNQSFNAFVNYCNRSGSDMGVSTIMGSYVVATTGAVVTALGLNRALARAPTLIKRFVPFTAVAAANCVNIPAMRSKELTHGIKIFDENNNYVGLSKIASQQAVTAVVFSRIIMASPSMLGTPIIINYLEKKFLRRARWMEPVIQVGLCGLILVFATPLACALFQQRAQITSDKLEPEIQEKIKEKTGIPGPIKLYYNKGL